MRKFRKILWLAFAVCVLLWGVTRVYLHYSNTTFPAKEIDRWFEPVTSKYGIKIVYRISDDFFSDLENPPIPAGPDRRSKVTPMRHRVLKTYSMILRQALEKYPVNVVKQNLEKVYFAGEINQAGFRYGGSYDPFRKIVYLVDNGSKTKATAISTFHHEFSSLLLNSRAFLINSWESLNPTNFNYFGDVYDNWDDLNKDVDFSREANRADYEKGFLSIYGQTNFENDFNEYSAMIFTCPRKFRKIMDQYPRVRGKFEVWLKFYQEIDPIFTESYLFGGESGM